MGSSVPADGYIDDSARTTTEVKSALNAALDVLRRMPGSSTGLTPYTISAGNLTPIVGWISVEPEGGTADFLDTIDVSAYSLGAEIVLQAGAGDTITINHNAGGSGSILLTTATFAMTGSANITLRLDPSNFWSEVNRNFGTDTAAFRTYLGLGDAALEDVGSGNGLDADTVDGQHASAFLAAAGTAANASQLGGVAASDYVRKSVAALQSFVHNIQTGQGRFIADHSLGNSSGIEMHIGGAMLARLVSEDASPDAVRLELFASPGSGTVAAGVRLDTTGIVQVWDGSAWETIYTSADGIGAGVFAGDLTGTIQTVDPSSLFSTGGTSEYTATSPALVPGDTWDFVVPSSMCWTPRFEASAHATEFTLVVLNAQTGTNLTTKFRVIRATGGSGSATVSVACRYVIGDPPVNV